MAKEFDIYLREHLTECDLIVYSIPYHDGISVTNRLILEAALNSYVLQKLAAVQMKSVLVSHIDEMIKLCYEKLNTKTILGSSVKLEKRGQLYMENAPLIIDASSIKVVERILNEAESSLVLAAELFDTQVALSTGEGNFQLAVDVGVSDTLILISNKKRQIWQRCGKM